MLLRGTVYKLFEAERKKGADYLSRIVLEVSSEILYQDSEKIGQCMADLRHTFGTAFLLSEYGDEYCPVLRLSSCPVDYVLLDRIVNSVEMLNNPTVVSAIRMAKDLGKKILLDVSENAGLRRAARDASLDYLLLDSATQQGG